MVAEERQQYYKTLKAINRNVRFGEEDEIGNLTEYLAGTTTRVWAVLISSYLFKIFININSFMSLSLLEFNAEVIVFVVHFKPVFSTIFLNKSGFSKLF